MIDVRAAWAAGLGMGELRELTAARTGHDRRTVRAVRRVVARGEAAPDVPRARLAIAIARDMRRQLDIAGPVSLLIFAAIILFAAFLAVREFGEGTIVLGVVLAAFVVLSSRQLLRRPRARRLLDDSERRNAALLAAAGERYVPAASGVAEASARERLLGSLLTVVYFTALFGVMRQWIDGDAITAGGVIAEGAPFGLVLTAYNQAFMVRRNRAAAA
ncbi:MAG TPA: hypothetical protein VD836_08135 [Solirubrobacteraceae bacterium]|nr:hypothetical protein [Solirubrobacteraceae bacterium]